MFEPEKKNSGTSIMGRAKKCEDFDKNHPENSCEITIFVAVEIGDLG